MDDINNQIDELLTRSVDTVYPSREVFKKELLSGKKLSIYAGIDATATQLHLGHTTNLFILRRFHKLGHKITFLVGDFTAQIGDPSDKKAARVTISKEDVENNLKTFKDQASKILDFTDTNNQILIRKNSEWLENLSFEKIIELTSSFTVQQMIERDIFRRRIKENKPLYVHEFLYPVAQGYDSVALKTDVEVGGTEQTFNMLAGRTLVKKYLNKEKYVITTTLLENPKTGEKLMNKSLGTGVDITEEPTKMFGKIMALADESMIQLFTDCTDISIDKINEYKQRLGSGENPKNIKIELAETIISIFHSEELAQDAKDIYIKTFSKGGVPENIKEIEIKNQETLTEVFVEKNIISSKSEARRLAEAGGIKIIKGDEKAKISVGELQSAPKSGVYQIGKKEFVKIKTP